MVVALEEFGEEDLLVPSNVLEFVTISTLGNTVDFGNLTLARDGPASGSSHIKGIWAGGGPVVNNIDTINIGSLGNAVNFGDLTIIASYAGEQQVIQKE